MLRTNSTDEDALQALIRNPNMPGEITDEARAVARQIRDFFIGEKGWAEESLVAFRFRDLMALCEHGEIKLCRTAGRRGWASRQDDLVLWLTLRELKQANSLERAERLSALAGEEQVGEILQEKTLALSAREWAYIERLVHNRFAPVEKRSRRSGAELGEGIFKLLQGAYGQV